MKAVDQDGLYETFSAEAAEHLRTLTTLLLALEREPADRGSIREMFLAAHTLKGSAAMLGMQTLATVAHRMEDVLQRLREPAEPFDSDTADLLFRCLDVADNLVRVRGDAGPPRSSTYAELLEALEQHSQGRRVTAASVHYPVPARRILLVEESATVRMAERLALEEAGYEVSEARGVQDAGSVALARAHDLVVAGHQLSDGRGIDLAGWLRNTNEYRETPIILACAEMHPDSAAAMAALRVHVAVRQGPERQNQLARLADELLGGVAAGDPETR